MTTGPTLMAVFVGGPLDGDERSVPARSKEYTAVAGLSDRPQDNYLIGRHSYELIGVTRTRGGEAALLMQEARVEDAIDATH
jgi:hypothetical protein